MKNLRKLGGAVVLTLTFLSCAFAGQTDTPPCPIPEPGQTDTPPCSAAPLNVDTSGVTSTTANTAVANDGTSLTEIATDVVLNILSLY